MTSNDGGTNPGDDDRDRPSQTPTRFGSFLQMFQDASTGPSSTEPSSTGPSSTGQSNSEL